MPITYERVIQQALNRLGAVLGGTAATVESNYDANPSTSTVSGSDFTPSMVEDALAATLGEIVEVIASMPLNPERAGFTTQTAALSPGALIPRVDNSGNVIVGVIGAVRDSSDDTLLLPTTVDRIRNLMRFASNVYSGFTTYWYAIDGNRIYHTRANIVIDVCTFARPSSFVGNVPLDDWHEGGLVAGAVAKLALKESLFADLQAAMAKEWGDHLDKIRNYGNPVLHGMAQGAPSTT